MTTTLLAFLHNGAEASGVPVTSRALHYGDGVFRTLLRYKGQVVDARPQIEKLIDDARRIGLKIGPGLAAQLGGEVDRAAADTGTAVLKLMLVRGGTGRGYAADDAGTDRYVMAYRPPRYPAEHWSQGIVLQRSTFSLGNQPMLAGIKHLNRLEQVLACQSTPSGVQEILLGNAAGDWICGGRSNLFVVAGGRLLTPSLDRQGVCGRMRDRVLAAATALGIEYRIGPVSETLLAGAEEMFVTNSLIGLWPVRQLDGRALDAPGAITRQLAHALAHPRLS